MKKHNFTPEQSEQILNAVENLLLLDDHFDLYSKHIHDLFNDRIKNSVEEYDGKKEFAITPDELQALALRDSYLSDFFFGLEDIVSKPCQ